MTSLRLDAAVQWYVQHRFLVLFLALMLALVVEPLAFGFSDDPWWFEWTLLAIMIATIFTLTTDRHMRRLALALGVPPVLLVLVAQPSTQAVRPGLTIAANLAGILLIGTSVVLVVKNILQRKQVESDSLFGAICGYLLLGIAWAMVYTVLELASPGSFVYNEEIEAAIAAGFGKNHLLVYFSFVTLTTLGYGDISPVSAPAQTFAWMEAVTGQFYFAIVVAGLVGVSLNQDIRAAETSTPSSEESL